MSVTIRLSQTGKKNNHSYRIVVCTTKSKRDGENLDILGHYNPNNNPVLFEYDKKRFAKWVKDGAMVTDAVQKIIDGKYSYIKYDPKKAASKETA